MRRMIYLEDEAHETLTLWSFVGLLFAALCRIVAGAVWGELFADATTTPPLSVLDVQRAGRLPRIHVTRDRMMLVGETHCADGLEIVVRWRGARHTFRVGQVEPLTASRPANLGV